MTGGLLLKFRRRDPVTAPERQIALQRRERHIPGPAFS
jgi:hypothetical protein